MGNVVAITEKLLFKGLDLKLPAYWAVVWRGKGPAEYLR